MTKASEEAFKAGDRVAWNTSHGTTHGKVQRRLTSPGDDAAHKPGALTRI